MTILWAEPPVPMGELILGSALAAGDPTLLAPKFDRRYSADEQVLDNAVFEVKPGRWHALGGRILLSKASQHFLASGDAAFDALLESEGVQLLIIAHEQLCPSLAVAVGNLELAGYLQISSGRIAFVDADHRHQLELMEQLGGPQLCEIVGTNAIALDVGGTGAQPIFAHWVGDQVALVATERMDSIPIEPKLNASTVPP